jgi:hypothetical protein
MDNKRARPLFQRLRNEIWHISDFQEAAEKVDFAASAPKGASDFEGLTVSLKRYPDTTPEFSAACPGWALI